MIKKEQRGTKEKKKDKEYEKEYFLCFFIEIKSEGQNIYKYPN